MRKVVDYYYSLVSPWTYLGGPRLDEIIPRTGAVVDCKPVDFSKVFPTSGGLPLAKRAPQRQAYRLVGGFRNEAQRVKQSGSGGLCQAPRVAPGAG